MGLTLHIIAERRVNGLWEVVLAPGAKLEPCRDRQHEEMRRSYKCYHCGNCNVEPSQWWRGRTWNGTFEAMLDGGREDDPWDHLDHHGVIDKLPDLSVKGIVPHRELPTDLSKIGASWERACDDAEHGNGWATLAELQAFDWQATFWRDAYIEVGVHAAWVAGGKVGPPTPNPPRVGKDEPEMVRDAWQETYAEAAEGFYELLPQLAAATVPVAPEDVRIIWWRH